MVNYTEELLIKIKEIRKQNVLPPAPEISFNTKDFESVYEEIDSIQGNSLIGNNLICSAAF
jgi:hypothetical protein